MQYIRVCGRASEMHWRCIGKVQSSICRVILWQLAPHEPNDILVFPGWAAKIFYNFGDDPKQEYQVSELVDHAWDTDNCLWFCMKWGLGDLTWEPLMNVDDIATLDDYLTLQNVEKVENLHRTWMSTEADNTPINDLPRLAWMWKPSAKLHMQIMLTPMEGHLWC